jgi:hypothetical protein
MPATALPLLSPSLEPVPCSRPRFLEHLAHRVLEQVEKARHRLDVIGRRRPDPSEELLCGVGLRCRRPDPRLDLERSGRCDPISSYGSPGRPGRALLACLDERRPLETVERFVDRRATLPEPRAEPTEEAAAQLVAVRRLLRYQSENGAVYRQSNPLPEVSETLAATEKPRCSRSRLLENEDASQLVNRP